jgi:hypothetical protein
MLQENSWLFPDWQEPPLLNSEHVQNIAVLSLNGMTLISEPFRLYQLLETSKVVTHENFHLIWLSCIAFLRACSRRI